MPLAFVLITSRVGWEDAVVDELRKIESVKECYSTSGPFDILAKLETESMEKLEEIVSWKIRRIDNINSTLTMIVIDEGNRLEF